MGHKGGHWYVHEECILRTAVCQRHRSGRSDIKQGKIKPVALTVIKLRLSEGTSQLLSQ